MSIRTLATLAIAGPVIFALLVLIQDVLQYDYLVANGRPLDQVTGQRQRIGTLRLDPDPEFRPSGPVRSRAGGGCTSAVAAHRGIRGASRSMIGPAFIGLWGLGLLVSMFPIERVPQSFSGYAHGVAFAVVSFALIPMYLFMRRRLRRSNGWESFGRYTLGMGLLTLPLEIGSFALQEIVLFSWFYLWLAAQLLWCVLLGLRLFAGTRADRAEAGVGP